MILSGVSGRAALAVAQCPSSALVEVHVYRAREDGNVVNAPAADVLARAAGQEVTVAADPEGFVCFRLAGMDGDVDVELSVAGQSVRANAVRNTLVPQAIHIDGPFLVWAYGGLRLRPNAAYLRAADADEELTLELLGVPGDLQVQIPDLAPALEVRDRDGTLQQRVERVEVTEDWFGDEERTTYHDLRIAASSLPLRIRTGNILSSTASIVDKAGSAVDVTVRTPVLTIKQRRGRTLNSGGPQVETVTQVIYSSDLDVDCEVDGVHNVPVNCDWTMGGAAQAVHATKLTHRFAVNDHADNARHDAVVDVVVAHPSGSRVTLTKTLHLALPSYHGILPEITDDYLESTFHWTAAPPVAFDAPEDDTDLADIWRDKIGAAASTTYRLRAASPPVDGGPGVTALAAIPYNPAARGAARRIFGGVVNTSLRAKKLTVGELTTIVGHEEIHLRQHAAARDDAGSLWRALDDAGVDAFALREIEAHVWEMAQEESHKLLQSTVDYFTDFYRLAREVHTTLPENALKGDVAAFINAQYDAIPPYCADLKASAANGGAFDGAVRRIG